MHPYAVPLRAPDLSKLPPALIITAEYDPVRDEAEQYAQRLQESGVPVQLSRYHGMIHSFFRMFALFDQSKSALREVTATLAVAFASARVISRSIPFPPTLDFFVSSDLAMVHPGGEAARASLFLATKNVWDLSPERLCEALIEVGRVVSKSIEIVLAHHLATRQPIVLEGDGILPELALSVAGTRGRALWALHSSRAPLGDASLLYPGGT